MYDDIEEEFLFLASNRVRRVATPEGARFYGLPVGAIITPDVIKAKRLEAKAQGKPTPKGGLSAKSSPSAFTGNSSTSSPSGSSTSTAGKASASKTAPSKPLASSTHVSPTISGPKKFSVINASYSAPEGSRVFRSTKVDDVAYILTPDGKVHAFNEHGEVPVPEELQPLLAKKLSSLKAGDSLYTEDTFDAVVSGASLSNEAPGALLKKNGETIFSKQEDGTWLNEDIGVSLSDDDLQEAVDTGVFELQSSKVDQVEFSKLTEDELQSVLEAFPEEKQISLGSATLTKKDGDQWESSASGKLVSSETLAKTTAGTDLLSDKPASSPKPEKPEDKKKTETQDPLLDPENEINPANDQKKIAQENLATGADVFNASIGDTLYHDELGKLTKVDDFGWENEARTKLFSESTITQSISQGHVSKKPWKVEENDEEGNSDNPGGASGVPGVPGSGGGDSGSGGPDGSGDTADEGDESLNYAGFELTQEQFDKALDLIDQSKMIAAIKSLRTDGYYSLAEAKAIAEDIRDKHALHVDGTLVRTKARVGKNDRTATIKASGGATPEVFELENSLEGAKTFREAMEKSLANNPYAASVYVYPDEEYAGMRMFLAEDGKSGIAVHNGNEIVSVFSDPTSEHKKVGRHLISIAVQHGGTRLDAFDTVLPKIYATEGFVTKSRLKWNDDYAPDGWDKKTFEKFNNGEPDVVFMEYDENQLDRAYVPGEGDYVNSYDEGLASTGGTVDETETPEVASVDWEEAIAENDFSEEEITDPKHDAWLEFMQNHGDDPLLNEETSADEGADFEPKNPVPDEPIDYEDAVDKYDFSQEEITQGVTPLEVLSKKDLSEAIDALESHSGFQIKYGLKSLGDSHPFKNNPDLLDSAVADAKQKYPNLSPKQAFLADLKSANGTAPEPLADWELELLGHDTTKIQIGSETAKNTATGITGGSYSKNDIQQAIDLLENFDGKAFKSYLNKNNNKLGELSPNDIVGFNKDKTVTKQKFVDLLKKKLADNEAPKSPEKDAADYPLTGEMEDVKVGSIVEEFESNGELWEKTASGEWTSVIDGYVSTSKDFGTGGHFKLISEPAPGDDLAEDSPPSLEDIDPASLSQGQFDALPSGTKLYYVSPKNGELSEYTKLGNEKWRTELNGKPFSWSGQSVYQSMVQESGWSFKKPEDHNISLQKGDVVYDLKSLGSGDTIKWSSPSGNVSTFVNNGVAWEDEYGDEYGDDLFQYALPKGFITYAGKSNYVENSNVPEVDSSEAPSVDTPSVGTNTPELENGHALISSDSAKKVGGQAGSNEGGLYELETPEGPQKYYVKKAQSEDHGQNEALANALYAKLGVNAPEVDYASDGNLYSKIVDGKQDMQERLDKGDLEWLDQVQQDFAIDAWLSNRDVFGMTYDNILTDKDGNPWKIDNGGALEYRAMGEKKTDFGPQVTELEVFRTGKKAKVFGPGVMPKENELDGAKRLANLSPDDIRQMVKDHNLSDELADTLVARRSYVLDYYGLDDPYLAQVPQVDASTFTEGQVLNTPAEIDAIPVGGEVYFDVPGTTTEAITFRKNEDGSWQNTSDASAQPVTAEGMYGMLPYGCIQFKSLTSDNEDEPVVSANGIAPGKYNSGKGAKAHLWVKPDGSGVYTGMKGKVLNLDAEAVKKNYDAGMSNLVDTPDLSTYPESTSTETPSSAKVIPTLGTVDTLPDGVYVGPQGVKYTVKGDIVTTSKAVKTVDGLSAKVGDVVPNKDFLTHAPAGTVIGFKWSPKDDPTLHVKQEDGTWSNTSNDYYFQYAGGNYEYYSKKFKIISYPGTDENSLKKSSAAVKTKYLQGQLLDPETESSVFPPGHTGPVTFFGGATTVSDLRAYRNALKDDSISLSEKAVIHKSFGVPLKPYLVSAKVYGDASTGQEKVDRIVKALDKFLATAGTEDILGPGDFLPKDSNGFFKKPESLAKVSTSYYSTTGELSAIIEGISNQVGDGKLVGVNMKGGTKQQKSDWIDYMKAGNFAGAYEIEAQVASGKGKAHPTGAKHPGHPNNTETHKVKWGPAIDGELAAGTDVPGNWTELHVDAPVQEIDNFMILAKAQYPEYLSTSEKRQWVRSFRQGNQDSVDYLSVSAKTRKDSGEAPKSEPLVWTDDVQPAKSYTSMFDDTQFPQGWLSYANKQKANDWYHDNVENNQALKDEFETAKTENPYDYESSLIAKAVEQYFAKEQAAYLEELNKPKYKVSRVIANGSHPVYIVSDQFDRKKIFKPLTPGKEWRTENEAVLHEFSAKMGFSVPNAVIGEVNEGLPMGLNNKGLLMDFAPNIGSLGDVDGASVPVENLSPKQLGQLAASHVLDWFIDNDDSHSENILIGNGGEIIGIDKARGFLQYGHWHGLDVDNPDSLNINTKDSETGAAVVYADMIHAIKDGKFSQEQMDAAYKDAIKAAKRIFKSTDAYIENYVRKATESRTNWEVPDYATDWPTLFDTPTNQDELVAAVLARKAALVDDIEEMWAKLYFASGHTKPEKPNKALGEGTQSGWNEPDLMEHVANAKVWGAGAVHASAAFADGTSLIWAEEVNGKSSASGTFKLGTFTQQKVLNFLKGKTSTSSPNSQTELKDFPTTQLKTWKASVTAAGKDVSNNATTGQYNQSTWTEMLDVEAIVSKDFDWTKTVDTTSVENVTSPSGVTLPGTTVPQYQQALGHHLDMVAKVKLARENGIATSKNDFKDFTPLSWKVEGQTWTKDGELYKELYGGSYMHISDGVAETVSTLPESVFNESGWVTNAPEAPAPDPVKYTYGSAGQYAGQLEADGKKVVSGHFSHEGHPGSEYRVDLPTGETIFFRNGSSTSTYRSQRGLVTFHLSGENHEASLANVESYLSQWGIETEGADDEQVESVYWRQMFGRVINSKHDTGSPQVKAARTKLLGMKSELAKKLGVSEYDFNNTDIPEAIALTEDDEHAFWDSLARETFGADEVNTFLAEGGHLPQYQHMDLANPEQNTGKPFFKRIDVDTQKVLDTKTLIAVGNSGKDKRHFDYIKSGGMIATEERLRILGVFKQGTSSTSDQDSGGATGVFTRIAQGSAEHSGAIYGEHVIYFNPRVMEQIGTYSYTSDRYGRVDDQEDFNKFDPISSLKHNSSTGNETIVQNNISIADYLEIMVFENEKLRQEAIEEFKKLGLEMLRGVPIEERLVLRKNLDSAMAKVKEAWS